MGLLAKSRLKHYVQATISIIILLASSIAYCEDKSETYRPPDSWEIPFAFKIGDLKDVKQGTHVYLPVSQIRGTAEICGFDFLLVYDAKTFSFYGASANDALFGIPGEYEWEYFTYRFGPLTNPLPSPLAALRVVAIADQNNGMHHPKRYTLEDNMALFTLDFFVNRDRTIECQSFPVSFYWADCGDNAVAFNFRDEGRYNIRTGISQNVFDSAGYNITDNSRGFPTFFGAPDTCLPSERLNPIRWVDFYNGSISIYCDPPPDITGDVNLNGLPYEIGDVVVFFNYFIAGTLAFTINVDSQIAASDVDRDGIPLTVHDYYLLNAKAEGDSVRDTSTVSVPLKIKAGNSRIKIDYGSTVPVSMLWICMYSPGGGIIFDLDDSHANGRTGDTVIMFAPYHSGELMANTLEVVYFGEVPKLLHFDAAGRNGEKIIFHIVDENVPTGFDLDQNRPNPFNTSTSIDFALPVQLKWNLDIFNTSGQTVRSFSGDEMGFKSILWDGRDSDNRELPSGIYFYRLKAGEFNQARKMLLLK